MKLKEIYVVKQMRICQTKSNEKSSEGTTTLFLGHISEFPKFRIHQPLFQIFQKKSLLLLDIISPSYNYVK